MPAHSPSDLKDQNVLIVEDEYLIAEDLAQAFTRRGANVLGPEPTVERALGILRSAQAIDAAVLDVNLNGQLSFPVADALKRRGVRFVFATGYQNLIPAYRYQGVPRLQKPLGPDAVAYALAVGLKRNALLAALPSDELEKLSSKLTLVAVSRDQTLQSPKRPITHAYFPIQGLLSVLMKSTPNHSVEVGVVGYGGAAGIQFLLGENTASSTLLCKVPGLAYQIEAEALSTAFAESAAVRTVFMRYIDIFMSQIARTAAINARCSIEERLARALLMAQDRLPSDEIHVTQDHLAFLLGVRRPDITAASRTLEKAEAIRTARGRITIVDRAKLQELSGGAYGPTEAALAEFTSVHA